MAEATGRSGKRKRTVVGNWKLHKTRAQAVALVEGLVAELAEQPQASDAVPVEVVVCPPFTALDACGRCLAQQSVVQLGAQDVFWETEGPFTGAVSPHMLLDVGCSHVIVGHSERRAFFHEPEIEPGRKAAAAVQAGLQAIFCVGETLSERRAGRARKVVARQLGPLLDRIAEEYRPDVVVAYEPVWAIGTGQAADPMDAAEAAGWVRSEVAAAWGNTRAADLHVLYGGSVKPENSGAFLRAEGIDGALVGGASLELQGFAEIVRAARA